MDYSVRRIDSSTTRAIGASRRRKNREDEPEFELDAEDAAPPSEPSPHPDTHLDDAPVAPPEEGDVGGRIDLTA